MASKRVQIGRICPFCGSTVTYDEYFCRACHKRLPDYDQLDAHSTHTPETYTIRLRRFSVSAVLGIAGVGLAQFYNGDTLKGIGFFSAFLLVSFGGLGGSRYHSLLFFGCWIAAMGEGIVSAWLINQFQRDFSGKSYLLWAELGFLSLVVVLSLATGIPDIEYLGRLFPVVDLWMMR